MDKYLKGKTKHGSRIYEVERVGDFVRLALWLYGSDEVIFRGQRSNWPLLPSVARDPSLAKAEAPMLKEFKKEAFPFLDQSNLNDLQWLALAQHCELPTRMMDWTRNPLVALWFAVREPRRDQDSAAVVWAYSHQFSNILSGSDDPLSISEVRVYLPEHVYRTIQTQDGVFTVHPRPGRFEPFEEVKGADLLLTRIDIPSGAFWSVRNSLYRLGVHEANLYPGLGGVARKIKYKYFGSEDDPRPSNP